MRSPKALIDRYRHRQLTPRRMSHDDLYLVEFPKSGVTWLTFILANLIVRENGLKAAVNFMSVQDFVADIHISRDVPDNRFSAPGYRIIKSHAECNPLYQKVVYLWRDPVDVMASYYRMAYGYGDFQGGYQAFVDDPAFGLPAWRRHIEGWIHDSAFVQRMHFVSYNALKTDTHGAVADLLATIGWSVSDESIEAAIAASTLPAMESLEQERARVDLRRQNRLGRLGRPAKFVGDKTEIPGATEVAESIRARSRDLIEKLEG